MANIEGQKSVMETRRPIIEVKNLRKEYPVLDETVVALERINLTIPQGQICCIYGESGSGKSTLLNQLAGMEKPTKGGVASGECPSPVLTNGSWRNSGRSISVSYSSHTICCPI
jgi:putative ABC transport system ATP-binding protein